MLTTLQRTPSDGLISDDLETVDLDIAALERGYRRPQRPGYTLTTHVIPQPGRWRAWIGGRVARQRSAEGRDDVTPC